MIISVCSKPLVRTFFWKCVCTIVGESIISEGRDFFYCTQKLEAHLDMMTDKLRQESSEEALKVALGKVVLLLEDIKNGYPR